MECPTDKSIASSDPCVSFLSVSDTRSDAITPARLPADREAFRYSWPYENAFAAAPWQRTQDGAYWCRALPESRDELAGNSRWPAFFPSPICITTTWHDGVTHVEKVVGASIVNRFPYVVALGYCREPLSSRHYVRRTFMQAIEASGRVAVQFFMPGERLTALMNAIATVPEDRPVQRLASSGLAVTRALAGTMPVFRDAYLVYEARLVRPGRDFEGHDVNAQPWIDFGSHRVYFLEIETISLREDIADGKQPLHWRSLPVWRGGPGATLPDPMLVRRRDETLARTNFVKTYQPDYVFPGPGTIAFEADDRHSGFAIKHLPPLPEDQIEVDNNRARWPCFFPSSVGLITVRGRDGRVGGMSCGSTTILTRHPLTVAICVSYARINERYAPRGSLDLLDAADRFGCGVPLYRSDVLSAITYLGNVSHRNDSAKVANCGLTMRELGGTVGFAELPVHYDCRIVARVPLGTHCMFLGKVENVLVRADLTHDNPLEWCPWAGSLPP
jgi:flavin reductase (DIM6/NTAB) family NADH-FMN oxidoreductase RutF